MAAKFLGEPTKVVTGSYDRTLKIWDLRMKSCIETKFAGSSCNDLVTSDGAGSTIISGHLDKTIRFWDIRSEISANDIVLQGRITSLDLIRDSNYLLACVRDDSTIQLIDLRMNTIVRSFRLSCVRDENIAWQHKSPVHGVESFYNVALLRYVRCVELDAVC
ncbi:unnamed protein product [Diatraea saccharalis]|uniref:Uncharacterized protein n=1 Tax=Diatraea saccharalis TaxID=40085 RepID=A0A9N9R113_9NEOP|nr:unnamed protein product [Diatraea saccharalis]